MPPLHQHPQQKPSKASNSQPGQPPTTTYPTHTHTHTHAHTRTHTHTHAHTRTHTHTHTHTAQLQQIDTASATLPPTSVARPPTNTQQPQVVKRQHTPQTDRAGEGKRKKTTEFGQVRAFNKN